MLLKVPNLTLRNGINEILMRSQLIVILQVMIISIQKPFE